jgi:hypothetical protein
MKGTKEFFIKGIFLKIVKNDIKYGDYKKNNCDGYF